MIPPDQFIPRAEETGLIKPLTRWVLSAAVEQCAQWRRGGLDLAVAVNLSASNLSDPDLSESISAALDASGIPPQCLQLEITESAIMTNPAAALRLITRLATTGVQFSIDDFGTGYSSLAYLQRLPVRDIKIDKSLVREMCSSPSDAAIVRSVTDLAHNLDLRVVAEGVEDQGTAELLQNLGCDYAQGFHLGRQMPASAVLQRLTDSN